MAITTGTLVVEDGNSVARNLKTLNDSADTSVNPGHPLINSTGGFSTLPEGSGTATGALRVELPTNGTGVVGLNAGTNTIGTVNTVSPVPSIVTAATITRPADTTTYAAGDVVYTTTSGSQAVTHTVTIAKAVNQAFTILACRILTSSVVVLNGIFRVHLYNSQPTLVNGDNGAWSTANAGYIDSFDVTLSKVFSDGAYGRGIPSNGSIINCTPVSAAQTLYVVLEVRAGYVPTSSGTFIISFEVQ